MRVAIGEPRPVECAARTGAGGSAHLIFAKVRLADVCYIRPGWSGLRSDVVLAWLSDALERLTPWTAVLVGVVAIVALGVVDYITGPELAFSIFYLAPVATASWAAGARAGIPLAAVAAATWAIADVAAGREYTHPLIPAWNGVTRLGMFAFVAILISQLHSSVRRHQLLARTDPLTGAANARAFMEEAALELARSRRYRAPVTIVYIDLDDFKRINDDQGHGGGDAVLQAVARHLRERTRSTDLVARLGGDEFALLLRDTDADGAAALLPSLQARAEDAQPAPVGLSIGAVTYREAPSGVDEMIRAADDLMYVVKQRGKGSALHRVIPA